MSLGTLRERLTAAGLWSEDFALLSRAELSDLRALAALSVCPECGKQDVKMLQQPICGYVQVALSLITPTVLDSKPACLRRILHPQHERLYLLLSRL